MNLLQIIGNVLQSIFDGITWLTNNIYSISIMVIGLGIMLADLITTTTAEIANAIASIVFPSFDFSLSLWTDYLPIINTVMPLYEMWSITVFTAAFWSLILTVRWIKSFIPAVAN